MSKRKNRLGGSHNNLGSKAWRKKIYASDGQLVKAGSIIMKTDKSIKLGDNVYRRKNLIHAKIDGIVKIKENKINVKKKKE